MNNNSIKSFKLKILQYRYKYLSDLILKLQKHIENLFSNNIIDMNQKNQILSSIFSISKNLNSSYNKYIIDELDKNDMLDHMIKQLYNISSNNKKHIYEYYKRSKIKSLIPLR